MEWLSIVAGVVSGVLSGFGAAWVGRPAAQAAAEEKKQQVSRRRKIVDDGRALVAQAAEERWEGPEYREDPRFLALAAHLPAKVSAEVRPPSSWTADRLIEEISRSLDELELGWHLS